MEGCHERLESRCSAGRRGAHVGGVLSLYVRSSRIGDGRRLRSPRPRYAAGGGDRLLFLHAVQRQGPGQERGHCLRDREGQGGARLGPRGHRWQGDARSCRSPGGAGRIPGQGGRQGVRRDDGRPDPAGDAPLSGERQAHLQARADGARASGRPRFGTEAGLGRSDHRDPGRQSDQGLQEDGDHRRIRHGHHRVAAIDRAQPGGLEADRHRGRGLHPVGRPRRGVRPTQV